MRAISTQKLSLDPIQWLASVWAGIEVTHGVVPMGDDHHFLAIGQCLCV